MSPRPIYLDYNATTPIHPGVLDAMKPFLETHFGNPSSDHIYGRVCREALATGREQVAELIQCSADEIVFTAGGTESNNLAIRGVMKALNGNGSIVSSVIEHPATLAPCRALEEEGFPVHLLPVDEHGCVTAQSLEEGICSDTALVTLMHANNETGSLQPIQLASQLAKTHGSIVHTDAAQSVGKLPVHVDALGVDLLSIAGHKLYAPKGIGALYIRSGTPITPIILGAGHEGGLRPGTENIPYAVGLGAACVIAKREMEEQLHRLQRMREALFDQLREGVPGIRRNGHPTEVLPNTLNICFPQVTGRALLAETPDIAASTGSACHEHGETPSVVLSAMGLSTQEALGAVRLSVGKFTTEQDIHHAASTLIKGWKELVK